MRHLRSNVLIIFIHLYVHTCEFMKCVKRNERTEEEALNSGTRKALKFRRGMRMRENGGRDRRECAKGGRGQLSGQQAAISRGQP